MNYRSGILILLAVAALCVVGVAGVHANDLRAPNDFQQRVIDRTNMYRQQNGCAALTVNSKLTQAAQGHSDDMAYNDFFSHVGSNGSTFASRLQAAGYAYLSAAENIAAGYSTPESVVDAWFNESPPNDGHRQNILNCAFKDIGVGYTYLENDTGDTNYHYYWVQDFGQPKNGGGQTPTPTPTTPSACVSKPNAPTLLSPAPNATVNDATVQLDWNDVICADKYRVVVKSNAPSGTLADRKGKLKVSQYETRALPNGNYYWRVRACNAYGCKSSAWKMFRVQ